MNWKFWKKDLPIQRKSATIPLPSGSFIEYIFSGGSYMTNTQAMEFYRKTAAIATAVDMIAGAIEQMVPVLRTSDDDFVEEHEVLELLRNPNGFDSWRDFIGDVSRHYLVTHDCFITAVGNVKRPPIELWPAKPQNVTVTQAQDTYPGSYVAAQGMVTGEFTRQETRKAIRFYTSNNLAEMFHIMGFSSRNIQTTGDSPLLAAALEAKQIIAGRTHNLSLLRNGSKLSLLVVFKEVGGTDDEQEETLMKIKEQLTGPENAGNVAMVNNADISDIKEMGMSNKDMDYAKLDEAASQSVYLRYNIPLPLVTLKASTFNNMRTALEFLYDQAVLPNTDKIFGGLSKFLLPRYGLDPSKIQLTYNRESIQALKQRQLDELEQRAKVGIETDNELRELLVNRPPYEGGDLHYKPATLVPVGQVLFGEDDDNTDDEEIQGDDDNG